MDAPDELVVHGMDPVVMHRPAVIRAKSLVDPAAHRLAARLACHGVAELFVNAHTDKCRDRDGLLPPGRFFILKI
jgi:hypothetical protein